MANLRFSFIATAGTVNVNAPDLTVAQEQLFIDWLWANYAPTDPVTSEVLPRNAANEAESYRKFARALWAGVRANVVSWKHEKDKAAVAPPVVPET